MRTICQSGWRKSKGAVLGTAPSCEVRDWEETTFEAFFNFRRQGRPALREGEREI
jgi:hypothetical protein